MNETFTTQTSNSIITKIYTSSINALSFFTQKVSDIFPEETLGINDPSDIKDGNQLQKFLQAGAEYLQTPYYKLQQALGHATKQCSPNPASWFSPPNKIHAVIESDAIHSSCHQDMSDAHINHHHLIKNDQTIFSYEEVNCILNVVRTHQKNTGLCQDGKTNCLMSDKDYTNAIESYKQYYDEQKKRIDAKEKESQAKMQESLPPPPSSFEKFFKIGTSSFAYSFITTLLQKYVKPYLITNGQKQLTSTVDAACSSVMWLLTKFSSTITDKLLKYALGLVLTKLNIEQNTRENILHNISCAMTMTPYMSNILNPQFYLELSVNQACANVGEKAAFAVIHQLKKLKFEPPVENLQNDNSPFRQENTSIQNRRGF